MEKIVLNINKKGEIRSLLEILRSLGYIDSIEMNNKKKILRKRKRKISRSKEISFFKLAGIWKDRDIDLNKVRSKTWMRQLD